MQVSKKTVVVASIVGGALLFCSLVSCSIVAINATHTLVQSAQATMTATKRPATQATATTKTSGAASVSSAQAYRPVVVTDSTTISGDMNQLGTDCNASASTTLATCQDDLRTTMADIKAFQDDLDAHPAPACYQATDKLLRQGLRAAYTGSQDMLNGINDNSASEVDAGAALYQTATKYFNQSAAAISAAKC